MNRRQRRALQFKRRSEAEEDAREMLFLSRMGFAEVLVNVGEACPECALLGIHHVPFPTDEHVHQKAKRPRVGTEGASSDQSHLGGRNQ